MNFQKFTGARKPYCVRPNQMDVGQIVTRKPSRSYKSSLKCAMRMAMRQLDMEFSIGEDGDSFVIRRDK